MFILDPKLEADTFFVGDLEICRVLLMNNAHFPWLILVPRQDSLREVFDLSTKDHQAVMEEIRDTTRRFSEITGAYKMNIATFGNMVPQLHFHLIARFQDDAAWPNPVWNSGVSAEPYVEKLRNEIISKILLCKLPFIH